MKVIDLLEGEVYYKASRNEKGYNQGSISDWMKLFGAEKADVQAGLKLVFDDKALIDRLAAADIKVLERPKAAQHGTIKLLLNKPFIGHDKKTHNDVRMISVQPNGRIVIQNYNGSSAWGGSRYPVGNVPKPRVVVGKPIETIYKTLKQCLEVVLAKADKWSREFDQAKANA